MDNTPIITLFEKNELNIALLYSIYAEKIDKNADFWRRLSDDEKRHAHIISDNTIDNTIIENAFSREIIDYITDFVLKEIESARKNNITHKKALSTALRIERSMLEKKCLDVFTPASPALRDVFLKLNDETERHIKAILNEMRKNQYI